MTIFWLLFGLLWCFGAIGAACVWAAIQAARVSERESQEFGRSFFGDLSGEDHEP